MAPSLPGHFHAIGLIDLGDGKCDKRVAWIVVNDIDAAIIMDGDFKDIVDFIGVIEIALLDSFETDVVIFLNLLLQLRAIDAGAQRFDIARGIMAGDFGGQAPRMAAD